MLIYRLLLLNYEQYYIYSIVTITITNLHFQLSTILSGSLYRKVPCYFSYNIQNKTNTHNTKTDIFVKKYMLYRCRYAVYHLNLCG